MKNQDKALDFYTKMFGFEKRATTPGRRVSSDDRVRTSNPKSCRWPGTQGRASDSAGSPSRDLRVSRSWRLNPRSIRLVCALRRWIRAAIGCTAPERRRPQHGTRNHDRSSPRRFASTRRASSWVRVVAAVAEATPWARAPRRDAEAPADSSRPAEAAAFLASDRAGAMTGTVANLTCDALVN